MINTASLSSKVVRRVGPNDVLMGRGSPSCDNEGNIRATNEAWKRFALDNGGSETATGIGTNYLSVCQSAQGGGGQYIIIVEDFDLMVVVTGHDNDNTTLQMIAERVLPAFVN